MCYVSQLTFFNIIYLLDEVAQGRNFISIFKEGESFFRERRSYSVTHTLLKQHTFFIVLADLDILYTLDFPLPQKISPFQTKLSVPWTIVINVGCMLTFAFLKF